MSRSGYSDDVEQGVLNCFRANVERSIRGKRGQAFLRELASSLDAMPIKELVADDIVRSDKSVCAIGSVALARGIDVSNLDVTDRDAVGQAFNIAGILAAEIAFMNDDDFGYSRETPEARWKRMRKWVDAQLLPAQSSSVSSKGEP